MPAPRVVPSPSLGRPSPRIPGLGLVASHLSFSQLLVTADSCNRFVPAAVAGPSPRCGKTRPAGVARLKSLQQMPCLLLRLAFRCEIPPIHPPTVASATTTSVGGYRPHAPGTTGQPLEPKPQAAQTVTPKPWPTAQCRHGTCHPKQTRLNRGRRHEAATVRTNGVPPRRVCLTCNRRSSCTGICPSCRR